jgi:hypothetical protein
MNAVTRAATAGSLSLVLVCRSVTPLALISHLPIVCQMKQIPLITLHPQINTRMLAQVLEDATTTSEEDGAADAAEAKTPSSRRLQLCTTIGIHREHLTSTVAALRSFAHVPALHWLTLPTQPVSTTTTATRESKQPKYEPVRVLHTDQPQGYKKGKGAQKQQQQQTKDAKAQPQSTGDDSAPAVAPGGKQRIESATQRKKKAKIGEA